MSGSYFKSVDWRGLPRELASVSQARFEFAKEMLARNLRSLRVARCLSQETLGQKAGLSQAQISAIETHRGNPTIDSLQRIADVLGVEMSVLFAERK